MPIPIMNPRRYAAGPRPRTAAPLGLRYAPRAGDDGGGEDAEQLTPQAPGGGAARNYGPPPPPPAAAAGGAGQPQQAPAVSNFRRSLDQTRYADAAGAAAFAAAAPAAASPSQSAFYGPSTTSARAEQTAGAAKAAYLTRTRATANAQDPYGTGPGQLDRAEDRQFGQGLARQQADSEAGYVAALSDKHRAEAHHQNQEADVGVPAQAARVRAAGELDTAHAGQVPGQVAAENQVKGADAAYKTAQANNVAAGGAQDKAELAQLRKDHQTALTRIRTLETLLARQKPADDPEATTLPPPAPPAPRAPAAPNAAAGGTPATPPAYGAPPPPPAAGGAAAAGRPLDDATARQILDSVGGDKERARFVAKGRGYTIN